MRAGAMVQTVEDQTSDHVRYRVVVRGLLGEHLAGVFDQLEVDPRPGQASLTGNFADQASSTGSSTNCGTSGFTSSALTP